MSEKILKNIQELQQIFEEAKAFAEGEMDISKILQHLECYSVTFKSIAYEATAMVLALRDLEQGDKLFNWTTFLEQYGQPHAIQVHVGLGWALAQQRLDPLSFLSDLAPMFKWRVLDGYGYYDGFFRRRKMLQGSLPDFLTTENQKAVYYQGVGRSLWYSSRANIETLLKFIESLPIAYHADLWRGIGIASAYVGGMDDLLKEQLNDATTIFKPQLEAGIVMAIKSRIEANSIDTSEDLEKVESILKQLNKITYSKQLEDNMVYFEWITQLDSIFK